MSLAELVQVNGTFYISGTSKSIPRSEVKSVGRPEIMIDSEEIEVISKGNAYIKGEGVKIKEKVLVAVQIYRIPNKYILETQ